MSDMRNRRRLQRRHQDLHDSSPRSPSCFPLSRRTPSRSGRSSRRAAPTRHAPATARWPRPAASFGVAISVTNAGGEIIVLDSGGYGAVAITKSVSIISPPGIYAGVVGVLARRGRHDQHRGRRRHAAGPDVNGQGGTVGIHFSQGSRLDIDGCTVENMGQEGILVDGAGTISIANSTIVAAIPASASTSTPRATVTIVEVARRVEQLSGIAVARRRQHDDQHTTVVKNGQQGSLGARRRLRHPGRDRVVGRHRSLSGATESTRRRSAAAPSSVST